MVADQGKALPTPEELKGLTIAQIARLIREDWKKPYFGAVPYLDSMRYLHADHDSYGLDSAKEMVLYFLANATSWRGPLARLVKAELKRRYGVK